MTRQLLDLIEKFTTNAKRSAEIAVSHRIDGNTHLAVTCETEARVLTNVVLELKRVVNDQA